MKFGKFEIQPFTFIVIAVSALMLAPAIIAIVRALSTCG